MRRAVLVTTYPVLASVTAREVVVKNAHDRDETAAARADLHQQGLGAL